MYFVEFFLSINGADLKIKSFNVPIHLFFFPLSLFLLDYWSLVYYLCSHSKCTYLSLATFSDIFQISMPFQWQSWKIPIHSLESFSHFYLSSIETSLLWRISRSKAHQLEVYQVHLSVSLSIFPLVLRHNALIPASSLIPPDSVWRVAQWLSKVVCWRSV